MSLPAIVARDLSKSYHLGVINRQTLQDEVRYWWHRLRQRDPLSHMGRVDKADRQGEAAPDRPDVFWALRNVSLEIERGEIVGIIGLNGAGKTTLLKILSRITEPTSGEAVIEGRVGSLLEVGTGFHPELTGRENVYLNGTILGMRKREIEAKFDEIVAFSEIEKFIDTPVKRYSSGMFVRLAFAVAAHLEPEILLVDEVLAVGDAGFQRKCLGKMGEVADHGRTILFVSHNMIAIQALCAKAIWLDQGEVRLARTVGDVVSHYLRSATDSITDRQWKDVKEASNEFVSLQRTVIRPADGTAPSDITIRTPFDIDVEYVNKRPGARLHISLGLFNENNICVFSTSTLEEEAWRGKEFPEGQLRSVCRIPGDLLSPGLYRVRIRIVRDSSVMLLKLDEALVFDVRDSADRRTGWYGKYRGVVRPVFDWRTEPVSGTSAREEGPAA